MVTGLDETTWRTWWAEASTVDRELLLVMVEAEGAREMASRGWEGLPPSARQAMMAIGDPHESIAVFAPIDDDELLSLAPPLRGRLPPPPRVRVQGAVAERGRQRLAVVYLPLLVVAVGIDLVALVQATSLWRLLLTLLSIGVGMAVVSRAIREADRAGLVPHWAARIPDRMLGVLFFTSLLLALVLTVLGA